MVGAQSILVVTVVDGNLDAHAGINETDDSRRYANEFGAPAVSRTCETNVQRQTCRSQEASIHHG